MLSTGVEAARTAVVIVGGHEDGARVALDPLPGYSPPLRASSPRLRLDQAVRQALDASELPVCVVPMTLGRDPRLVADTARTLMALTRRSAAGRVAMAAPFGTTTLLTEWLRTAVADVLSQYGGGPDLAVLLTANAANRFDDAELFRIAHLVKTQEDVPRVEVAFGGSGSGSGSGPGLAEGVARCRQLGARRVAVIPADFAPVTDAPVTDTPTPALTPALTPAPVPEVIMGGPLLTPAAVSAVLAARIADAMLKLSQGDDGIAAGLDADHRHGHGGYPW